MSLARTAVSDRRRYAIVGVGSRHELYQDGIEKVHAAVAQLVGICDSNAGRIEVARKRSVQNGAPIPAGYAAADFGKMLAEQRPDVVIVTTADSAHHEYIVRAMEAPPPPPSASSAARPAANSSMRRSRRALPASGRARL